MTRGPHTFPRARLAPSKGPPPWCKKNVHSSHKCLGGLDLGHTGYERLRQARFSLAPASDTDYIPNTPSYHANPHKYLHQFQRRIYLCSQQAFPCMSSYAAKERPDPSDRDDISFVSVSCESGCSGLVPDSSCASVSQGPFA